jgi:hypothetical protein
MDDTMIRCGRRKSPKRVGGHSLVRVKQAVPGRERQVAGSSVAAQSQSATGDLCCVCKSAVLSLM